jgi:hypothetical protein
MNKMKRVDQYAHVRVVNFEGVAEDLFLTENELKRLRARTENKSGLTLAVAEPTWRERILEWLLT